MCIISPPRVCLGASSYQPGSFLPKSAYPSNASSPALSLILSIHYFSLPAVHDHSCCFRQRTSTLTSLIEDQELKHHRYPHSSNSNASLPGGRSFWGKWGAGGHTPKSPNKDAVIGHEPQMTIARTRLLTLCYGDMETIRMVCTPSPQNLSSAQKCLTIELPSCLPLTLWVLPGRYLIRFLTSGS